MLGLFLSLLYQFELAGIILLPIVIIALIWKKTGINARSVGRFILGGLIGLLPFVLWDLKQGVFLQTIGFIGWLFTKIYEALLSIFQGNIGNFDFSLSVGYFTRLVYSNSAEIAILLISISAAVFLLRLRKKKEFHYIFIFLWSVVALSAFLIRGTVSEAYMPLLFFPIIIIIAVFFESLIKRTNFAGWIPIAALVSINVVHTLKSEFFVPSVYGLTFAQRIEIVDYIIKDTHDDDYQFIYRGPGHFFEAGDNHYQYLLWWKGKPPNDKASLSYTLFERKSKLSGKFDEVIDFGYATIGVNK